MEELLAYLTTDTRITKIALGAPFVTLIASLFILNALSGDR